MQSLSFAVHIPLVYFGIALPIVIVFGEVGRARAGCALTPPRPPRAGGHRRG
jgi:hypothetical protein